MSRDDGFQTADISTVLLDDAKVRKLARRCPDDGELAAALVVYIATVLGSWREGRRLTASETESWVDPNPERMGHLQAVGLLDAAGRVPSPAWERHFRPAWERREGARAGGRKGAARRWGSDGDPMTDLLDSDDTLMPDRPTVLPSVLPTDSEQSGARSPRKNGLEPIGDILPDALKPDSDIVRLQKLAEELTGQAYVMQNTHSGFGYKAVEEQLRRHHFDAVERAWRQIANRAKAEGTSLPTLKQLVLGADDILNPIPRVDAKEQRADEEAAAFERRVARTRNYIDSLKATEG